MLHAGLLAALFMLSSAPTSNLQPVESLRTPDTDDSPVVTLSSLPPDTENGSVKRDTKDPSPQGTEADPSLKQPDSLDAELPPNALTTIDKYTGRNGVGALIGLGSGIGLSYRRYIVDKISLRITGAVFHLKDTVTLYSIGLTSQVDFMRDDRFVLYGVAGISKDLSRKYNDSGNDEKTWFFPSAGVGIELGAHDHTGFTYQFELSLTGIFADSAYKLLLPLPHVGVYYAF